MEANTKMISFDKAIEIIDSNFTPLNEAEYILLTDSVGRVLAEDILSDVNIPPFDKSAMDGYACKREDLEKPLKVIEIIPAGYEPTKTVNKGECSKIMTGAKIPVGANCVIMKERVVLNQDNKVVFDGSKTQSNICIKGEDMQSEAVALTKGTSITPQIIATLASVGKTQIKVIRKPKIGFFCTGSELVEPNEFPMGVQIRNSNASQLDSQIHTSGAISTYYGIIHDDKNAISAKIDEISKLNDIVIVTGGASVGDFDYIPQILEESGYRLHFGKVGIQPGKPVLYATAKNKHIFGLSGNPVSSFLQFELFLKPLLMNLTEAASKIQLIKMIAGHTFTRKNAERILFLPVIIDKMGRIVKTEYHGSAHIAGLTNIFGFLVMKKGITEIKQGEIVDIRQL